MDGFLCCMQRSFVGSRFGDMDLYSINRIEISLNDL